MIAKILFLLSSLSPSLLCSCCSLYWLAYISVEDRNLSIMGNYHFPLHGLAVSGVSICLFPKSVFLLAKDKITYIFLVWMLLDITLQRGDILVIKKIILHTVSKQQRSCSSMCISKGTIHYMRYTGRSNWLFYFTYYQKLSTAMFCRVIISRAFG